MRAVGYRETYYPTHIMFAALELGVKETRPRKLNRRISEYFMACGNAELDERTSWCGAFVAYILMKSYLERFPVKACQSQWWPRYGYSVIEPVLGDIVIFRDVNNNDFGHVGFFIEETKNSILVLGGNQGDSVNYTWYKKKSKKLRLLQYRRCR